MSVKAIAAAQGGYRIQEASDATMLPGHSVLHDMLSGARPVLKPINAQSKPSILMGAAVSTVASQVFTASAAIQSHSDSEAVSVSIDVILSQSEQHGSFGPSRGLILPGSVAHSDQPESLQLHASSTPGQSVVNGSSALPDSLPGKVHVSDSLDSDSLSHGKSVVVHPEQIQNEEVEPEKLGLIARLIRYEKRTHVLANTVAAAPIVIFWALLGTKLAATLPMFILTLVVSLVLFYLLSRLLSGTVPFYAFTQDERIDDAVRILSDGVKAQMKKMNHTHGNRDICENLARLTLDCAKVDTHYVASRHSQWFLSLNERYEYLGKVFTVVERQLIENVKGKPRLENVIPGQFRDTFFSTMVAESPFMIDHAFGFGEMDDMFKSMLKVCRNNDEIADLLMILNNQIYTDSLIQFEKKGQNGIAVARLEWLKGYCAKYDIKNLPEPKDLRHPAVLSEPKDIRAPVTDGPIVIV